MALRLLLLYPKLLPQPMKFQTHPFPSSTLLLPINPSKFQICCSNTNNNINDLEMATVSAIKIQLAQKEEAMKKSRQMLFTELCRYLDMGTEELKRKWEKMDEDDKLVLVKGFVAEWGVDFHPLSARSVKEMVDDYFADDKNSSPNSSPSPSPSPSLLFSGFKKFLGFQNKE